MERIPCNPEIDCPIRELSGCYEDVHHSYFPRRNYRTKVEKAFRNLDDNKKLMCRAAHNALHSMGIVPTKPPREEMVSQIEKATETMSVAS